jgi:putative transposase
MPEHVHLLISEPVLGTPSTILRTLKQQVSQQMRTSSKTRLPRFWEFRFYDFNVWSRKKKVEKLAYRQMNPVKRGLVENPKDWPWSSYAFYQGKGEIWIPVDPVE